MDQASVQHHIDPITDSLITSRNSTSISSSQMLKAGSRCKTCRRWHWWQPNNPMGRATNITLPRSYRRQDCRKTAGEMWAVNQRTYRLPNLHIKAIGFKSADLKVDNKTKNIPTSQVWHHYIKQIHVRTNPEPSKTDGQTRPFYEMLVASKNVVKYSSVTPANSYYSR